MPKPEYDCNKDGNVAGDMGTMAITVSKYIEADNDNVYLSNYKPLSRVQLCNMFA